MKANQRFSNLDSRFWSSVRFISAELKYTVRGTHQVKTHTIATIEDALMRRGMSPRYLERDVGLNRSLGQGLVEYFDYRAKTLNEFVESRLMDSQEARENFESIFDSVDPTCPLPMNKQRGDKRHYAYLTCMVNMITEYELRGSGIECDYDPRRLTVFTNFGEPVATLSRRVDGCLPTATDPVAVWEIKEFYSTTTFGSRVADSVYETALDGMELNGLRDRHGIEVSHVLFVDSHRTWWVMGRSYLCRLIDLLNMGLVDEVIFGREILKSLPRLVREWIPRTRERL